MSHLYNATNSTRLVEDSQAFSIIIQIDDIENSIILLNLSLGFKGERGNVGPFGEKGEAGEVGKYPATISRIRPKTKSFFFFYVSNRFKWSPWLQRP